MKTVGAFVKSVPRTTAVNPLSRWHLSTHTTAIYLIYQL